MTSTDDQPTSPEGGETTGEVQEQAVTAGGAALPQPVESRGGDRARPFLTALVFLLPALVILGALLVYPIVFTVVRSFFDRAGDFTGIDNYRTMVSNPSTRTAIRNNLIWVVAAPTVATILGLIFAVLAERVRWETAFKVAVFMPMAISFLAAGVIFRLVYEHDPDRGLANAALTTVTDAVRSPGEYRGARAADDLLEPADGGFVATRPFDPGTVANLGLVAIRPADVPDEAEPARPPPVGSGELGGVVWLDFSLGGGGERGEVDPGELGLPGIDVRVVRDGEVVASATTAPDGSWLVEGLEGGEYTLRLAGAAFREPWGGLRWLGQDLVTASTIGAFLWIWAGFAMIVIGAGLSALPRDVLEAARVDGANEWQVFRSVTIPLLRPVLIVVFITLVINVLKIFDLVLIIPPGSVRNDATVIALEVWRVAFGGPNDHGLASALAVLLFLLVIPAMAFNIRRFRSEDS